MWSDREHATTRLDFGLATIKSIALEFPNTSHSTSTILKKTPTHSSARSHRTSARRASASDHRVGDLQPAILMSKR